MSLAFVAFALPQSAHSNDLPSAIRTLRQDDTLVLTSRLFTARCTDDGCVTDNNAPQIGNLLKVNAEGDYEVVCNSAGGPAGSFAFKVPNKVPSTFSIGYRAKSLRQLLQGLSRAETAFEIVQNILEEGTIEARQVYSELAIGDMDLRLAMRVLSRDCARQASAKSSIVLERRFGTITLVGTIKPSIRLDELKSSLLQLNELLGNAYEAKIGAEGKKQLLQVSARGTRLFLLRAVSWGDVQKHHPGWVDQIPNR